MDYYSANQYFLDRFGCKVYKLALDGGMTCPNRDGTVGYGGCIFCSEGGSGEFSERIASNHSVLPPETVDSAIEKAKNRVQSKVKSGKFIAYFQSYTNTYASVDYLRSLFFPVINRPEIVALSIGTRPDCLPKPVLSLLRELNAIKPVFVELGLQTVHDQTAKLIRRGYDFPVYEQAVKSLKSIGVNVITHLILGLPGETKEMMIRSAEVVGGLTDGVKLQLLHVLKNTELEKMYERGEVTPLSLEEYASLLRDCLAVIPKSVVIHRLTGDGSKKLLVAPTWSADKKRALNYINGVIRLT